MTTTTKHLPWPGQRLLLRRRPRRRPHLVHRAVRRRAVLRPRRATSSSGSATTSTSWASSTAATSRTAAAPAAPSCPGTSTTSRAPLDRLIALGATEHDGIRERGEGFTTASVVDPFGNLLGIMTNPHWLEITGALGLRGPVSQAHVVAPDLRDPASPPSTGASYAASSRRAGRGRPFRRPSSRSPTRAASSPPPCGSGRAFRPWSRTRPRRSVSSCSPARMNAKCGHNGDPTLPDPRANGARRSSTPRRQSGRGDGLPTMFAAPRRPPGPSCSPGRCCRR